MSTNDVPGHKSEHNDELATGCWAEHDDGSLIFVESTEGGRVIYSVFDMVQDPIIEYRDAMPEKGFKKQFSWNPKKSSSVKWTWHDKTPFPWDTIIKSGAKDGMKYASAHDQLNAAQKVAKSIGMEGRDIDDNKWERFRESLSDAASAVGRKGKVISDKIQRAIDELRT